MICTGRVWTHYHSTLATSTLIILFVEMLKLSKKIKKLRKFFCEVKKIYIFGIFRIFVL